MFSQVWARLPQSGRAVHEVQRDEEAEREDGGQRLRSHVQTTDQRAVPRRLSPEELAVQRLVPGTHYNIRNHSHNLLLWVVFIHI